MTRTDAMRRAAAALNVVDPRSTGIGGDAFAPIRAELLGRGPSAASMSAGGGPRNHEMEAFDRFEAGGTYLVLRADKGLQGASEPRKDGRAFGR